VTAGLALAGFGLGAFVASGQSQAPEPAAEPTPVVETVPVTETMVVPLPTVEIPGISDAAGRLLTARGYADVPPEAELGLAPAVIRVLEREGTVLLVPEGDGIKSKYSAEVSDGELVVQTSVENEGDGD